VSYRANEINQNIKFHTTLRITRSETFYFQPKRRSHTCLLAFGSLGSHPTEPTWLKCTRGRAKMQNCEVRMLPLSPAPTASSSPNLPNALERPWKRRAMKIDNAMTQQLMVAWKFLHLNLRHPLHQHLLASFYLPRKNAGHRDTLNIIIFIFLF
jgi:hypothetical protein